MSRNKIIEVIEEIADIDNVEKIEDLVTGGFLDSFAILMLIGKLEQIFSIELDLADNIQIKLNSVNSIENIVNAQLEDTL